MENEIKSLDVRGISQDELDEILAGDYIQINGKVYATREKCIKLMEDFVNDLEKKGKIKFLNEKTLDETK